MPEIEFGLAHSTVWLGTLGSLDNSYLMIAAGHLPERTSLAI
jgi:hypothetical protein